jgi:phage shock protein PspC (stress-responsive transcriptional regulator)
LGLLGLELLLDPALVRLLVVLLFGVKRRGLSLEIGADLLREREMVL